MGTVIRWQQRLGNFERALRLLQEAFAARIIEDGQTWIDMLEQRNLMSHTYDSEVFETVFRNISERYVAALERVFAWLKQRASA